MKSTGFHRSNLPDFRVKSGGFNEILGHSPYPALIKLKSFFVGLHIILKNSKGKKKFKLNIPIVCSSVKITFLF